MNFENARKTLIRANANDPGFDVRKFKLTQSFLRLEQLAVVGTTNYIFRALVNEAQPQVFNTEQRLNLQDSFIPSEIGFFLAFPSGATDDTFKPLTYVSPTFTANDAQYQKFYNGVLSIAVNNNILVPAWDMWRHWYSPQTQQTAALGAGSPMDQVDGKTDSFYPMEPNVALIGSKNIVITLTLKTGLTAIEASSRIVLWFRGILAQNSTVVS